MGKDVGILWVWFLGIYKFGTLCQVMVSFCFAASRLCVVCGCFFLAPAVKYGIAVAFTMDVGGK